MAGIVLGKSGLGWIEPGPWLDFLFLTGLVFLLFLAGLETNFAALRSSLGSDRHEALRSPLGLGLLGLSARLGLAFAITVPLGLAGLLGNPSLVAFLLASTSLGVVLGVLGECRLLGQPYGQLILVSAGVADFGTVVLLTVFYSPETSSSGVRLAVIGLLIAVGIVLLVALRRVRRMRTLKAALRRLGKATSEVPLRGAVALLFGFTALAHQLGIEVILGAFVAGAVISALSDEAGGEMQRKIHVLGYGLFVPLFFVLTGARTDLQALLSSTEAVVLVPVLLISVFLVKGVPAVLYRGVCTPRECVAAGLLQSAQMTITVAGVEIGRSLGILDEALASALIVVALLSVLLAPTLFARVYSPRLSPVQVDRDYVSPAAQASARG